MRLEHTAELSDDRRAGTEVQSATGWPRRSRWSLRRLRVLADILGLTAAFALSQAASSSGSDGEIGVGAEWMVFLAALPLWVAGASLYGLYESDGQRPFGSAVDESIRVFHAVTVGTWLVFAISYAVGIADPDVAKLVLFWALSVAFITLNRSAARAFVRRRDADVQNTVIVGAGDIGQLIGRKLLQHPEYRLRLVGFVDADAKRLRPDLEHIHVLGRPDQLIEFIDRYEIGRVIVAFSRERHDELLDVIHALYARGVRIDIVPRLFEAVGPEFETRAIEGMPLLELTHARPAKSALVLKRVVDVAVATTALILTSPLFLIVAWRIKRDSPGPVFFRQTRLGKGMREFTMLKFRTMSVDADATAHREYIREIMDVGALPQSNNLYKLDRGEVVTPIGSWLRRTSVDELPQLINVLRGEMSLVGPRPCIPYELELFELHHFDRFLLPAGCTGLWQVTARAHSTFREALELDVAYVRAWSPALDLRILIQTPLALLRRTGTT
jgi:exopolysaccharide biosynthesis polyprenyl glycosylphosphotransferase